MPQLKSQSNVRETAVSLPTSRELGALFQDALYERSGLQAIYTGAALTGIAVLDKQSWIPFEGNFSGAGRLRWDSALNPVIASTVPNGVAVGELMADILEASMRRWSIRQQSLGPLMMGASQDRPPTGLGPNPGPSQSASLSVRDILVEVCLFHCTR